jgi:hypothetical protein
MTTTLFVDFGRGIGMGNPLNTTVGGFRDIFGDDTGSDLTVGQTSFPDGLNAASSLDFTPLNYDFNLSGGAPDNADIDALANAVLPIIQRTLEPFDINVVIASAANLADVRNSVNANTGDPTGQFDAYVFVTAITSNGFTTGGNSVGRRFGLFGIAAGLDLNAQSGNMQDEAALTFADNFVEPGTAATATISENLASRLAFTITHEAFHTFSYIHTVNTPVNQELLTSGDVIRFSSDTRENPFIVTRFNLLHDSVAGGTVQQPNNYLLAANNPDIGLRDNNRNGRPDLAYVTGTGAHDQITLNANGNLVNVVVSANDNSTKTNLIASEAYSINLATDTEGELLLDASINNDEVVVDTRIGANFRLRGGTGVDGTATESDLLILQSNGLIGTYIPGANPTSGTDSIAGTVTYVGGAQINFSEFEDVEADNIPINVNPLTLSSSSIQEGDDLFLNGNFINIDTRDVHNIIINWGDGSTPTLITLGANQRLFNALHNYLDDNPSGTPSDNYTITVTITDQDGDSGFAQSEISVVNVAPTITGLALDSANINENDTVTLTGTFTDPGLQDTHTAIINWGDGTTSTLPVNQLSQVNRTFQLSHQYLDDNPTGTPSDLLPITVTILDDDSGSAQSSIAIRVNNIIPAVTGLALSTYTINENDMITLSGTFIDPGTLDTHTVIINWGDGTTSTLPVNELNQANHAFQLSHQYLDDTPTGTPSDLLPITVTILDDDGGSVQASNAIRVNNINPVITSFTSNANFADRARAGKPVTINANFTDIGTLDTHRAFIDWGDGTPTQEVTIFQGSGSGAVQGNHSYAKGGAFTVKLTLNDDDTGINTASLRTIIIGTGPGPG